MNIGRGVAVAAIVISFASCNNQFRFDSITAPPDAAPPPCVVDGDCRLATLHCDAASGGCVECVNDSQCSASGLKRCDTAAHACAGCTMNAECGPDQLCEVTTGSCLFKCAEHDTCPLDAPSCDEIRGVCVRCRHDLDCAQDEPFCEKVSGRCLECFGDDDCPAARPRCDRPLGGCVLCVTSSDCTAPAMCDPVTHVCL